MKSSVALKIILDRLKGGSYRFVCCDLRDIAKVHGSRCDALNRLEKMFVGTTVVDWLFANVPDAKAYINSVQDWSGAARAYRIRWVEWMIEGYEAVGD
jgi:hypothetical protein